MINPRSIWAKVKKDQALNLSELAIASGYDRGTLSRMALPLQAGKMTLSDFKRVLRKRADRHERALATLRVLPCPSDLRSLTSDLRGGEASAPADARPLQAVADIFYGRSSRSAKPGASRPAQESPLHNTA